MVEGQSVRARAGGQTGGPHLAAAYHAKATLEIHPSRHFGIKYNIDFKLLINNILFASVIDKIYCFNFLLTEPIAVCWDA